jgi:hypothetical protein
MTMSKRIYIKDDYDLSETYCEDILVEPKFPEDMLLSVKIAFSEFVVNVDIDDDEGYLYNVWVCASMEELVAYLNSENFEITVDE